MTIGTNFWSYSKIKLVNAISNLYVTLCLKFPNFFCKGEPKASSLDIVAGKLNLVVETAFNSLVPGRFEWNLDK